MKHRFFLQSKPRMFAIIMILLLFAASFISFATIALVTNMFEEKTKLFFIVCILGLISTIAGFLLFAYLGFFIPNYILDNGIRCKNKTLNWDEIKITAYSTKESPIYLLVIDRQYLSGIQTLSKKKRHGFSIALDRSQMKNVVKTILSNIKSKVVFLDTDGKTETDNPHMSQDLLTPILEHNKRIDNAQSV